MEPTLEGGGPAFPCETERTVISGHMAGTARDKHSGLTIRDYFAAQAIAALADTLRESEIPAFAAQAYRIADAMMKARSQPQR